MNCPKCGRLVKEDRLFCHWCGAVLPSSNIKNAELVKEYSQKLQQLISAIGTAQFTQIAWDPTIQKYVQKVERLKLLLRENEFSDYSKDLIPRIKNFVERCREPEFHIAFVGTIKAGKSTLINALLGRNLASTSVTPETAVLTKFKKSQKDYIRVVFYTSAEWKLLWDSISSNAGVFKEEYTSLNGDSAKNDWINHETYFKEISDGNLESEIKRWTSSKHVEHYFVKEVEIGLSAFKLPEGVVFVDTPGLDDAVKYRSDVTRQYIDRANAVFACVKSDSLTGGELDILYRIFTNSSTPEKIYVLGTQLDTLKHPLEDWKEQKTEWIKYLSQNGCYGSKAMAERNIIHVAAYVTNLCRDYDGTPAARRALAQAAMALTDYDPFNTADNIESYLQQLSESSNISAVQRKITQEIIPQYKTLLMSDIEKNYEDLVSEISKVFSEISNTQQDILQTSTKDVDKIRKDYENAKSEMKEVQSYREQLSNALDAVIKNTEDSVNKLCEELNNMVKRA